MGLFGTLVGTIIETAKLPVAILKDAATLGGIGTDHDSYTAEQLDKIKKEAKEE